MHSFKIIFFSIIFLCSSIYSLNCLANANAAGFDGCMSKLQYGFSPDQLEDLKVCLIKQQQEKSQKSNLTTTAKIESCETCSQLSNYSFQTSVENLHDLSKKYCKDLKYVECARVIFYNHQREMSDAVHPLVDFLNLCFSDCRK